MDRSIRHCEEALLCGPVKSNWFPWSSHGMTKTITEHTLGLRLTEYRAKQEGYVSDSFPAICGFQENSAI
ncbi:hypothetical protein [Rickettsia tamurae]|uniref:hypothetical protein n=1 Tax=Rickettsia tamurae TaxID=334545 RepID=UPI0001A6055D|nr:hypothetical protein REIS_0799 [Rickettsia endosymbiont of Ixodes scapularis]